MARIFGSFLLLLIVFLILSVAVLNPSSKVDINLHFGHFVDVPLVFALFLAFLVGSILTFLYLMTHAVKLQMRIRKLTSRNKEFEEELTALRNIPVEPTGPASDEPAPAPAGID